MNRLIRPLCSIPAVSHYSIIAAPHLKRVLQLNGPRAGNRPRHVGPVRPGVVGHRVDLDGAAAVPIIFGMEGFSIHQPFCALLSPPYFTPKHKCRTRMGRVNTFCAVDDEDVSPLLLVDRHAASVARHRIEGFGYESGTVTDTRSSRNR